MKLIRSLMVGFLFCSYTALPAQTFVNFTINQDPVLVANAGSSSFICDGASANLVGMGSGGDGSFSYAWTPSADVAAPTNASTTADPSATTIYTFTVTDGNNCSQTDTMVVTLPSTPLSVDAGSGINICPGGSANLSGLATGGYGGNVYDWSPGSTLSDSTTASTTATPSSTTTYTLVVTDMHSCTSTDAVTVTIIDCSGIEETSEPGMNLYPNPNNGSFTLLLENVPNGSDTYVKITSVTGAIVYERNLNGNGNYQIQLSDIAKGVYQVVLYDAVRSIASQTILIQ